jgi:hypothetical protein
MAMLATVKARAAVIFVVLGTATGRGYSYQASSSEISNAAQVLQSSTDADVLEHTAMLLARSGVAGNLEVLGRFLHDPAFLGRLDPSPDLKTGHLSKVIAALAEHPTPEVADLCLSLAEDPAYVAVDDRESFLLETLAKVKPMSQRAADLFQTANERGYFAFNARLLAENASPRALALFQAMMLDKETPLESRVECLHVSVVPHRTELPILQTADRILSRASERGLVIGVTESVFDFRQRWFGIESGISGSPAWQTASPDSLRFAAALAAKVLQRRDLTPSFRSKVERERGTIVSLLGAR